MNSVDLFTHAFAGAQTESSMKSYSQSVNIGVGDLTGWMAEKANEMKADFKSFMDSRLWEFSARIMGDGDGDYVGRFEIGYLGTANGLQGAQGFMRDYIMASPTVRQMYEDDLLDGYGGEFSSDNVGIGRDNIYFRRATNGVVRRENDRMLHSHFSDTGLPGLSFRERVNIHKTWRAADAWLAETFLDITSVRGENRKDHQENIDA